MLLHFSQRIYLEPPLTISPTEILPSESDNCVMLHRCAECLHEKFPITAAYQKGWAPGSDSEEATMT